MGKAPLGKKSDIRNVVLYARVSTAEQAEKDLSIPAQLDALRRYCADRGYAIGQEYVEPGASGTDANRKVFRRMMEDVLAPSASVQAVLVYQTSRFMRNVAQARALKDALRKRGVRVIAICQETSDDPMGQFIEGIFELVDQYESDVNGMRTTAAMRENAKRGYFNGSQAPYGFRTEKKEVRPGMTRNVLVPNPAEIETLREVFRAYVAGSGAKSVARTLNARGLRYRKGGFWSKDLVLKVIEEEAAIGTYYWGKFRNRTSPHDRSDWIPIKVEPVLERELFEMAQQVRAARDPERNPGRTSSSPLLLAGLVKCGKCGAAYQLQTSGKPSPNGEGGYRYYNCRSALRIGKEACAGHAIPVQVLESAVLEHVAERLFSEERCSKLLRDLVEQSGLLRQKTNEHRLELQRQMEDIERRLRRWEEGFETGMMPADLGAERVRELRAQRDELAATLAKVVPLRPPPSRLYSPDAIRRFQASLRDLFLSGDTALTKNYLRFLVSEVVITGSLVELVARAGSAIELMASGTDETRGVSPSPQVRTTVVEWLQLLDSNQRPGG